MKTLYQVLSWKDKFLMWLSFSVLVLVGYYGVYLSEIFKNDTIPLIVIGLSITPPLIFVILANRKYRRLGRERRRGISQRSSRSSSWISDKNSQYKRTLKNLKKQQSEKEQKQKEEIKQMKSKFAELEKKLSYVTPKEIETKNIKKNTFHKFPSRADLNDNFSKLSPREMEELTGVLFEKKGYSVEITKQSGDYGIDVWATDENEKIGIQVKKWTNDVGFNDVSKTLGSNLAKANRYIVISTTSFFSKPALNWQKEISHMIELWDTNRFKEELQEHDIVIG